MMWGERIWLIHVPRGPGGHRSEARRAAPSPRRRRRTTGWIHSLRCLLS